jgi:hypothetical protein
LQDARHSHYIRGHKVGYAIKNWPGAYYPQICPPTAYTLYQNNEALLATQKALINKHVHISQLSPHFETPLCCLFPNRKGMVYNGFLKLSWSILQKIGITGLKIHIFLMQKSSKKLVTNNGIYN